MTKKIPTDAREYLARIGAKGGRNGKGKPKVRPPGYYAEIGRKGGLKKKVDRQA